MNEVFVSFSLAKKLKEKGFVGNSEIGCYGGYYYRDGCDIFIQYDSYADNSDIADEEYLRPTIYQVLTWLREEKKLSVEVFYGTVVTGNKFIDDAIKPCWSCCVVPTSENFYGIRTDLFKSTISFASWEEAALTGITFCLDNLIYL